jgi:glycosyltransferase involved in cell wall biosynthesis
VSGYREVTELPGTLLPGRKICHLTSAHIWDDTRIFHKMCRSLSDAGHEVHLVAARGPRPPGKTVDGVRVHLLQEPANRLERMLLTSRRVLAYARKLKADIYHFHDPEFLPWARRFQKRVGAPVIYDVHEDYRVHMAKPWISRALRPMASRGVGYFEDTTVRRLAGVVSATPHIARRFVSHPNSVVVQNFARLEEFNENDAGVVREEGLFVYVGTFSPARGIVETIQALPFAGPGARLVLAGRWPPGGLRAKCAKLEGWAQVEEVGYLDRPAMATLLSRAQAGVVLFHPVDNYVRAQPLKLFEYMAAGLPVIASDFPLWREIVGGAECGLLVDPLDPDAIAEGMTWIIDHPVEANAMGQRGRRAVARTYNWAAEATKLVDLYKSLLCSQQSPSEGPS